MCKLKGRRGNSVKGEVDCKSGKVPEVVEGVLGSSEYKAATKSCRFLN